MILRLGLYIGAYISISISSVH